MVKPTPSPSEPTHSPGRLTAPCQPERLTLSLELQQGLGAQEAERRALAGLRAGDRGARVAAFYLADLADRGLHQRRGCASLDQYAKQRLNVAPSTLSEYVRVGRALQELPVIDELLADGKLRWSQVRALTRVVTPETERAWGEWAVTKSVRETERQVARHEKGDLPTDPERRRIHTTKLSVHGRLNPVQEAVWSLWRETLEKHEFGGPVSDTDLLMWLAHRGVREVTGEPLTLRPPRVDLDPCNYGREAPHHRRARPTKRELREEVLARDGGRCVSCGSKRNLSAHHIHWRRYGGPTVLANLVTLCESCHSLVHDRFLILQGEVESLVFLDSEGQSLGRRAPPKQLRPATAEAKESTPRDADGSTRRDSDGSTRRDSDGYTHRGADETTHRGADETTRRGADESTRVSFNDVPRVADSSWWRRHRHLFAYSTRTGGLEFEPGIAPTVDPTPLPPASREPVEGLDALVGQERVRESLRVAIRSSAQTQESLGHVLLLGAPGLGKTSMARAIGADLGGDFSTVLAPTIRDVSLLVRQLTSLRPGSVLFLDEAHRLPAAVSEVLYDALEGGQIDLPVRCGWEQRSLRIRLAPFTLIAATTEEALLPEPLRSRFVYQERLEFYNERVLGELVEKAAVAKGLLLTPEARDRLAAASRDTPRRGLALLQAVCDEARARGSGRIEEVTVDAALARTGTTASGVTAAEFEYLHALAAGQGTLGLSTLSARLGTSRRNVQRVFEPFLLRRGLVRLTPRGRMLTRAGWLALATRPPGWGESWASRSA